MAETNLAKDSRDFPGSGKAKCFVCGDSVINHDIGPCPTLKSKVIYISDRRRFGKNYRCGNSE